MPAMATIRQGIMLWLVVTSVLPYVCFQEPRVLPRKYHPPGMVESVERELIGVEQRDTETSYRFSRFRRNRRSERVSEVVKLLSDRNVWDGYYPPVKSTEFEFCHL